MPAISAPVNKLPYVNIVDGVAGDRAEDGAQAADDAGLLAMRDRVVADNVVADGILVPAVLQGALDGLHVAFGRIGRGVVVLVAVFAQGDARADRVADRVVLDDPAFAPVGADQADLLGGGRGPVRGGIREGEAADGDVVHARLLGIEDGAADVDLHRLLVGIDALELGPDRGVLAGRPGRTRAAFGRAGFSTSSRRAASVSQ